VEDEVHFLFQCPQYNLLRNEYNIPFINIYDFNKINDFINPLLIHDAKLVCKFIKEAMFLGAEFTKSLINWYFCCTISTSFHHQRMCTDS
jgi:hypothetical protein